METLEMTRSTADPRPAFARAAAIAADALAAVTPDELDLPTPTDMDVRALIEHLVMANRRVAFAGRGEPPAAWPTDAPDVTGGGWNEAWQAATADAIEAWRDDAVLARPTALPWTTVSGAEVLAIYTSELTVHTWDLARATGLEPAWDDEVVAVATDAMHAQLPVPERGPVWEAMRDLFPPDVPVEPPFADAVAVADDAPAIDKLVAWCGRQP